MTDNEHKELLLKAKPILFNTDMVRAILDGRKTVTRRALKDQDSTAFDYDYNYDTDGVARSVDLICDNGLWAVTNKIPYFENDILYVRETYGISNMDYDDKTVGIVYKASENAKDNSYREIKFPDDKFEKLYNSMAENSPEWHPSIHMPKEAARIFLRVTNVRVERLQDITITGLQDEGVLPHGYISQYSCCTTDSFEPFRNLWDSTIKKSDLDKYAWVANPWVWVIEFERVG